MYFFLRVDGPINGGVCGGKALGAYNLAGFIMRSLRYGPTNRAADYWNFMAGQPGFYLGNHWNQGCPLEIVSCYGSL